MGFWTRSGKSRKKGKSVQRSRGLRPMLETLERRDLLTGFWTTVTAPFPDQDGALTSILLSNGTVLVQGNDGSNPDQQSNLWFALTPDASGSYINGTWTQLSSENVSRHFFSSDTLQNGNVFVVGGEYSLPFDFTNTAEIYNPTTNVWTLLPSVPTPPTDVGTNPPPSPTSQYGDDPTAVLPNGNILAGYFNGPQTFIYNTTTNSWSTGATKLRNEPSDEESWVKLPDGSVLSYDIFSSIASVGGGSNGVSMAQRYFPSTNTWQEAGTITDGSGNPVFLSSPTAGFELGPALLLPDGRVFQLGATGSTAFYTPSTNSWTVGPSIPNAEIASDDPAAVLPNGDVLVAVSPFGTSQGSFSFPGPTNIYEYSPTTNVWTDVTPPNDGLDNPQNNAFITAMLDLPTGQTLLTNFTTQIEIYTPDGAPQASWAPAITSIQHNTGTTYTLTGTQLNGLDEGAAYGDDDGMSTNFPIVRLTNLQTGTVFYAQTSNWSSTGVQTGSLPETVNFSFPSTANAGTYLLEAVANGIASTPELVVFGSNAGDTVDITSTAVTFDGSTSPYSASSIAGIDVFEGNGANTITTESTNAGLPINLFGGPNVDNFNFGSAGVVSGIVSSVAIDGGTGNNTLTINDNADTTARTISIDGTQIGAASGDNLFNSGGSISSANIENLVLNGGSGGNQINVVSTNSGESVSIFSGTGANTIFVGSNGSGPGNLQNILGPVSITGQGVATAAIVDDSSSTTGNTLTLSNTSLSSAANNLFGAGGSLAYSGLASLTANDGSGGNQIQVLATAAGATTTINTGAGDDNIVIDSTPGNPTGDVNEVLGSLIINGEGGNNALLVEDSNDAKSKTFTITASNIGAAAGDDLFGAGASLTYNAVDSLTLNGSSGGDTIFMQSTPAGSFDLNGGNGNNSITVGSGGSTSTVAGIVGAVTINGGAGADNSLTLDNSGSNISNIVTLTPTTVGTTPGDSFFPSGGSLDYGNIQNLTVNTSNAVQGDTISVFPSTTTTFFVNAGNPTLPTNQGDALLMNLAGITGANLTTTGVGAGNWTFTNAQTTFFTGIEKQSTLIGLGGVVFQDVNGNGTMDPGDTGISGLTITLFEGGNQLAQQTTGRERQLRILRRCGHLPGC